MITANQLRAAYIKFYVDRGHTEVPSARLVPENDPSTLFTSSGMQPMVPYLLGQKHPGGTRIVDSQKSIRAQDIEEVGDNRHTTYFEMLGNWSLGDYFKKEQLNWVFEFFASTLKFDPKRLYVTVFGGNDQVPRDDESIAIWKEIFKKVGIDAEVVHNSETEGMKSGRIFTYPEKKNWWSRSGVPSVMPPGEPGGPDSEMFYDFGVELKLHENSQFKHEPCHVNCDCGRFMEIGNSVFMQFQKQADGSLKELPNKNVDFGGGFERILAAVQGTDDVFKTDLFTPIIQKLEKISGHTYKGDDQKNFRVIADHIRASVMLINDGVEPSNKAQGYVLRRLIRRAARCGRKLGLENPFLHELVGIVAELYKNIYIKQEDIAHIQQTLTTEEQKFAKSLTKGLKEIEKLKELDGSMAFQLYETYGFPFELTEEIARERGQHVEYGTFRKAFEEHQAKSRTSAKGMFKGGLADHSETVTKYHTATHLLHAALRKYLGEHVSQQGSNITGERLRFDFSHDAALTEEQKSKVEHWMNEQIEKDLPVTQEFMEKDAALKAGAMAFFKEKYAEQVSVYTIGRDAKNDWVSKELCGGPHVSHTGEIGKLKIFKEESIGSGKRRIYVKLAQ